MHTKNIITEGQNLEQAKKALILLHGRGGSARDIISLAKHFPIEDFILYAPQATNNSWYPYSFLAPSSQNEPWLSSALELIEDLLEEIKSSGISSENIFLGGFSQGACLTAEFVTRNASGFGGIFIFTGGLIGEDIYTENYSGDFKGTPIFISTGNPDAHVPIDRVLQTARQMESMNASVTVKIFDNRPHTVSPEEITQVNNLIFNSK